MLTQSLNTSISSTKAAPVPFAKPDQFCALTGHAGLVASGIFVPEGRGDLRRG